MADTKEIQSRHPLIFRILHSTLMISILVLVVTGLYIHKPFTATGWGMMMSMMRGVHFFAAGVLTITVGLRILGMFARRYGDWKDFVPSGGDLKSLPKVIAYYAHLAGEMGSYTKYNALQKIVYGGVFVVAIVQILLGFAIQYVEGWLRFINYGIFVSEVHTRVLHYILTWAFILFLVIHVYMAIRENFEEMKTMHLMQDPEEESA